MTRIGLKKIELKHTTDGQVFGITEVYKRVTTTTIRNPFENVYLQVSQAPFKQHSGGQARPQDLDEASMSVLVRSRIVKEQIHTLSKMTLDAEKRIEGQKHASKDSQDKSKAMLLSNAQTANCLSLIFSLNLDCFFST